MVSNFFRPQSQCQTIAAHWTPLDPQFGRLSVIVWYSRLTNCIMNRFTFLWKKSDCHVKFRINVVDAVTIFKLVCGLEAVNLTPSLITKLNARQFKGFRNISNIDATFINRNNTNASILKEASSMNNPTNMPGKNIRPFGEYVQLKREALLKHTVRAHIDDPLQESMLRYSTPLLLEPVIKRVGRPRISWANSVYPRICFKKACVM